MTPSAKTSQHCNRDRSKIDVQSIEECDFRNQAGMDFSCHRDSSVLLHIIKPDQALERVRMALWLEALILVDDGSCPDAAVLSL